MLSRRPLRILFALVGIALFLLLIRKVGAASLLENIQTLGWGFVGLIGLGGASHLAKTWAWRYTFPKEHRTVPFTRLLSVRLAGEGVSQLTFAGQLVGESTRAWMLRTSLPGRLGVSSVVLDRSMFTFTSLLLVVIGTLLSLATLNLPDAARRYNALIAVGMLAVILLGALAVRRRWPFLSAPLAALGRLRRLTPMAERHREGAGGIETIVYDFYEQSHSAFWYSFGLNLAGHFFSMLEVYLVLNLLGLNASLLAAFIIEALTKVVNFGGLLIPGNIGASEGGTMLILQSLDLGGANGLTLAIARRLRGLFWAAFGLGILYLHGLRTRPVKDAPSEIK